MNEYCIDSLNIRHTTTFELSIQSESLLSLDQCRQPYLKKSNKYIFLVNQLNSTFKANNFICNLNGLFLFKSVKWGTYQNPNDSYISVLLTDSLLKASALHSRCIDFYLRPKAYLFKVVNTIWPTSNMTLYIEQKRIHNNFFQRLMNSYPESNSLDCTPSMSVLQCTLP